MPSTEDNLALVMSAIKHSFTKIQPDFDKVARDVNIPADSKNPVNAAKMRLTRLFAAYDMTAGGEAKIGSPDKRGTKRAVDILNGEDGEVGQSDRAETPSKSPKRAAKTKKGGKNPNVKEEEA